MPDDTEVAATAQAIAKKPPAEHSLVKKFAEKYSIDSTHLLDILRDTAFRLRNNEVVSTSQMAALLVVADAHGLNPFTREIFAYLDKYNGVVPVVSVDGWARIINENADFDGVEFKYSEQEAIMPGGKLCPVWCEAIIHRKNRSKPTIVREYLDELYVPPRGANGGYDGPWQTHTKRMMRHKTLIQCARIAFGFAGVFDEDEANRILESVSQQDKIEGQKTQQEAAGGDNKPAEAPAQQEKPVERTTGRPSRLSRIVGNVSDVVVTDKVPDVALSDNNPPFKTDGNDDDQE